VSEDDTPAPEHDAPDAYADQTPLNLTTPSLKSWGDLPDTDDGRRLPEDVALDCGWGRLIFGHTFRNPETLTAAISREKQGERDIALYIRDPHVLLALAPHQLFLDPSHTYRLYLSDYRPRPNVVLPFSVEPLQKPREVDEMHRIYRARKMVPPNRAFVVEHLDSPKFTYLVAKSRRDGAVLGQVIGVDHTEVFSDPENGCSLWCLAVDPQCTIPGIGEALVRGLIRHFKARGRSFLDLSVLHDNRAAIGLYERLGFRRVPVFCLKKKNAINEDLYTAPEISEELNPYARIITDEARRRGISVEILDAKANFFRLAYGGRSICCRESLTELTTAIAMSRCADKPVTSRILSREGLRVPEQAEAGSDAENAAFLHRHGRVVVKPAVGEQGQGVVVDITTEAELERAIRTARDICPDVILEEFVSGQDLRIIVIDYRFVAAAIREPPQVTGTGQHSIRDLIEKQSRRRRLQTGGESSIPLDDETARVIGTQGYQLDDIPPAGEVVLVRKTANLHTGGNIVDVTSEMNPELARVAERAARALEIPVTGLDLLVEDIHGTEYAIIEANERPGLANHEPQPTAERFVDFLFPQTANQDRRSNGETAGYR